MFKGLLEISKEKDQYPNAKKGKKQLTESKCKMVNLTYDRNAN